jgi:membrane-bound lytic murein transglycosylase B
MDKSLMLFILIGIGGVFFVTNFVGDIQREDEVFRNEGYDQKHAFDQYKTEDSIGREILDVTGAPASVQMDAWNASALKKEFLDIFPDFGGMQVFAQERVRGQALRTKLKSTLESVEAAYFSGAMNAEDAKRKLGTL